MNASTPINEAGAPLATTPEEKTRWRASLQLRFERRDRRTGLVERQHSGPLVVQKTLHPEGEGTCHAVIVHPPGGIAGGDQLEMRVRIGGAAHALLTTPGAAKWYKANGRLATQCLEFDIDSGGLLEWLPQETILFDAARAQMQTRIALRGDARYAGWDIACLGRSAAGERFRSGLWRQQLQILRDDTLIWGDYGAVEGSDPLLHSMLGMQGRAVVGRLLVAAGAVPPDVLERCREAMGADGDAYAVSALPDMLVATYLGDRAEAVRAWFEALWAVLRPWYAGIEAQRPRIWNT
jgi:urease accessory protein